MADPETSAPPEDEFAFDPGMKKKKKKSKKPAAEDVEEVTAGVDDMNVADEDDLGLDLSLKKKKKKKKKVEFEVKEGEEGTGEGDFDDDAFSGKKKKKKKKKGGDGESQDAGADEAAGDTVTLGDEVDGEGDTVAWAGSDRDYTYSELLNRIFGMLKDRNPDGTTSRGKITMKPPQVVREGTKKTVFINFADACKAMHRSLEHVLQFVLAELGTSGSLDGQNRLVLKGRFTPKTIENLLRKYIGGFDFVFEGEFMPTWMQRAFPADFMRWAPKPFVCRVKPMINSWVTERMTPKMSAVVVGALQHPLAADITEMVTAKWTDKITPLWVDHFDWMLNQKLPESLATSLQRELGRSLVRSVGFTLQQELTSMLTESLTTTVGSSIADSLMFHVTTPELYKCSPDNNYTCLGGLGWKNNAKCYYMLYECVYLKKQDPSECGIPPMCERMWRIHDTKFRYSRTGEASDPRRQLP